MGQPAGVCRRAGLLSGDLTLRGFTYGGDGFQQSPSCARTDGGGAMTTGRHTQQRSVPEEFERYLAWLISSPRERWSDTQLKQRMFSLYRTISDDERRVRQPEGRDVYLGEYYGSREPIQISAEEFNACIDVYGDFYKRTYGIDVREVPSPTFDEYLEVCVDGSRQGSTLDPSQTGTSGMTSSRSSTTCRRHGCGPSPSVRTSRPGVPRRGCWCARRNPKRGSVGRWPCLHGLSSHLWRV